MFVFFFFSADWSLRSCACGLNCGALNLMNRLPDSVERRGADGIFDVWLRRLGGRDVDPVLLARFLRPMASSSLPHAG
jgi:Cu2+-exporting ATPase